MAVKTIALFRILKMKIKLFMVYVQEKVSSMKIAEEHVYNTVIKSL